MPDVKVSTAVLTLLVLQNSGLVLLAKFSFRHSAERYNVSSVIACSEVLKLILSIVFECCAGSESSLISALKPSKSKLALVIPSLLYVAQNNLQLFALQTLTPGVFVVVSQLKILTTALFSVVLLKTHLERKKIFSIVLLACGVSLAQLDSRKSNDSTGTTPVLALLSLLVGVTLSGLAGVLSELLYKAEGESIWVKNVYMSAFSFPFAFTAAYLGTKNSFGQRNSPGMFTGYDNIVFGVIILQSLGGLIVAAVLKYANNILKCFAVSLSIVICLCWGHFVDNQELIPSQLIGISGVIASVYMYSARKAHIGREQIPFIWKQVQKPEQ